MRNVLTLLFVVCCFICCDNGGYSEKAYTKIRVKRVSIVTKEIIKEKTVPTIGDSLSIKKVSVDYHIIAASSKSIRKAKSIANYYKRRGYKIEILESNGRHRVSLGSYKTKEDADSCRQDFSIALVKNDLWILKN